MSKPSINWDHVHPDYKWLYQDKNGMAHLSTLKPRMDDYEWWSDTQSDASRFASFKPGNCDWKESLVLRPTSPTQEKEK